MRTESVVRSAGAVVRSVGAAAAAALMLTLAFGAADEARAQGFGVDAGAGLAIPMAEMADGWRVGPSFGLGVVGRVSEKVGLRADGDLGLNGGASLANGNRMPDLTQFRFTGGVELHFTDPDLEDWYTVVGAGAGGASVSTDVFPVAGGGLSDFGETYFTAYGALRVGYRVTPSVAVSLRSRLYLTAMDRQDTQNFTLLSGGEVGPLGDEWSLPTQLRAELSF